MRSSDKVLEPQSPVLAQTETEANFKSWLPGFDSCYLQQAIVFAASNCICSKILYLQQDFVFAASICSCKIQMKIAFCLDLRCHSEDINFIAAD